MEKLCQEIAASHMQRQVLLQELKLGPRQLRKEMTRKLQSLREQFSALQKDHQSARAVWQEATRTLARKRKRP